MFHENTDIIIAAWCGSYSRNALRRIATNLWWDCARSVLGSSFSDETTWLFRNRQNYSAVRVLRVQKLESLLNHDHCCYVQQRVPKGLVTFKFHSGATGDKWKWEFEVIPSLSVGGVAPKISGAVKPDRTCGGALATAAVMFVRMHNSQQAKVSWQGPSDCDSCQIARARLRAPCVVCTWLQWHITHQSLNSQGASHSTTPELSYVQRASKGCSIQDVTQHPDVVTFVVRLVWNGPLRCDMITQKTAPVVTCISTFAQHGSSISRLRLV